MHVCVLEPYVRQTHHLRQSSQGLQVKIIKAATLRNKNCHFCTCGAHLDQGSTNRGDAGKSSYAGAVSRAAAVGEVSVTSSDPGSSSPNADQITRKNRQRPAPTYNKQQLQEQRVARKHQPASRTRSQQQNALRSGPHKHLQPKAIKQQQLGGSSGTHTVDHAVAQWGTGSIGLLLSELEVSLKKRDPGSCQQVVLDLKVIVKDMSADQVLASASPAGRKAWWRKVMQAPRPHRFQTAGTTSDASAAGPSSPLSATMQTHSNQAFGSAVAASDLCSITAAAVGGEGMHAELLQLVTDMQPAQRMDLYLHGFHPKLVQLWLATGHQGWAQQYIMMLMMCPPCLPAATYNSFVASCSEYHSIQTLHTVLEVSSAFVHQTFAMLSTPAN